MKRADGTCRRPLLAWGLCALLSPLLPGLGAGDAFAAPIDAKSEERPLSDLGVELVSVQLTAESFMIDLRYRITDVTKARQLVERNVQPVLVNESTGDRYYVPRAPKIGPLRQTATPMRPAQAGKVYFMMFANPNRRLQAGEKVTLYAGDSVVRHLEVR